MAAIGEQSLAWLAAQRVEAEPGRLNVAVWVAEYSGLLYRVAYSVLRNRAEAEDVVQDCFVRVLQQQGKLQGVVEVRPWLVKIAWNLALDRRRRIQPKQMDALFAAELVGREMPADEAVAGAGRMRAVLGAIEALPAKEREVVLLSAMEELSAAEIGTVLGRSESSVRATLFRARTRLKQRLGERLGE